MYLGGLAGNGKVGIMKNPFDMIKEPVPSMFERPRRVYNPDPVGKLKRVHFVGSADKLWIDEVGNAFEIDFRSGSKIFIYQACRE
jgi:hypothetical protein